MKTKLASLFAFAAAAAAWGPLCATDYSDWSYCSGIVAWRTAANGTGVFDQGDLADYDPAIPGFGASYTLGSAGNRGWTEFCSGASQTAWVSPGLCLVYDGDTYCQSSSANFNPLSLGGLWVQSLAPNGGVYTITGSSGTRFTDFGEANTSSLFVFDRSFTIDRLSATRCYGDVTIELGSGAVFENTASMWAEVGATIVLRGDGTLVLGGGMHINSGSTLDVSASPRAIDGDLEFLSGAKIVLPDDTLDASRLPLQVCTGTLTVPGGMLDVQIGQTVYANAIVSTSGGTITALAIPEYVATIAADTLWDDPSVWSRNEIPAGDLAGKYIQIYTSNGATMTFPASGALSGATVGVFGNGALTNAPGSTVTLKDVTIAGKVANAGEIRTEGDVSLSSAANEFGPGSLLKVAVGCTSAAFRDQGLRGDLYISPGAVFLSKSVDALWYNSTSLMTIDVYGTLDMGDSRWTLPNKERLMFNVYDGAEITASGSNSNGYALDFFQDSSWLNVVTDGNGGSAALSAPIRIRNATYIGVDGGMTLYVSGDVLQHQNDVRDLFKHGTGDVVFSGNLLWKGVLHIAGHAMVSGGSSTAPLVFNGTVASGELFVERDSFLDARTAPSIDNIRARTGGSLIAYITGAPRIEEDGKVALCETAAADGKAKVLLDGNATVEDSVTLFRADGTTQIQWTSYSTDDGVTTILFAPETSGQACWLDFEFNGDVSSSGRTAYQLNGSEVDYLGDNSGIHVSSRSDPWSGTDIYYPQSWSAAIRAVAPERDGDLIVAFGTLGGGLIGLAKGAGDGEVNVVYTTSNTAYQVAGTANVASPTNSMHLYVFTKTPDGIDVYCDGALVNHCAATGLSFGTAFQVGSVHSGLGSTGLTKPAADSNAQMDFLRLYDVAIGPNMIAQLSEEYPYVSTAGLYKREVAQDGDWVSTDAWEVEGTPADEPAPADKAMVTMQTDATLAVNLSATPNYEILTFEGPGRLTLAAAGERLSAAKLVVDTTVTVPLDAADFSGTIVEIGPNGALEFDVTPVKDSYYYRAVESRVRLTGVSAQGMNVSVFSTDPDFAARVSVDYDTVQSCYVAVVTPRSTVADLCVTPAGGSMTIDDSTVLQEANTGLPATILAGDRLSILAGPATSFTFSNANTLEEVSILDSSESDPVTVASAPATAVQVFLMGGANGFVEFVSAPGSDLAFDASWGGTFVAGWSHSSGKFVPDYYGRPGSTLVVKNFSAGYLATEANGVPTIAVTVKLDGPMVLTNGFSSDTPWNNMTSFEKMSGTIDAAFTTWTSSSANKVTYYEIETLENYKGTFTVSDRSAIRFGTVALDSVPGDGVYVSATASGGGFFGNLKETVVTAGGTSFTGLAFTGAGLVKAYAAIGDDTYATVAEAILAANAANTATPGSVTEIELLNSPTIVIADIEAAGWRQTSGDPTRLEPFLPLVEPDSALGGTITIDTNSTWYANYMDGQGHSATDPAANGMTYGVCYALGLDPTDPDAKLDGLTITIAGGTVTIDFGGISPNVTIYCQLQSRTTLPTAGDSAWTNDGAKVPYVNGAQMSTLQGSDPTKFYRVVLTLN